MGLADCCHRGAIGIEKPAPMVVRRPADAIAGMDGPLPLFVKRDAIVLSGPDTVRVESMRLAMGIDQFHAAIFIYASDRVES